MTIAEFLREFWHVAQEEEWDCVEFEGDIRRKGQKNTCPIRAVATRLRGKSEWPDNGQYISKEIGLDSRDYWDLECAIHWPRCLSLDYSPAGVGEYIRHTRLRRSLLHAAGIPRPTGEEARYYMETLYTSVETRVVDLESWKKAATLVWVQGRLLPEDFPKVIGLHQGYHV